MILKKRSTLGWAFFFISSFSLGAEQAVTSACAMSANGLAHHYVQSHRLVSVVDGDTLRLAKGIKVRVVGLNTPELARDNRPAEPLAEQAALAAKRFFADQGLVYLKEAAAKKDRYGRVLAHVYRADGKSLTAYLLAKGLAWQVVVPPNVGSAECYRQQEQQARTAGLGVWSRSYQQPIKASALTADDAGYRVVTGTVKSVQRSRKGWWLQMGRLAILLSDKDSGYFNDFKANDWRGKSLSLKAWVIDRSDSRAVREKGYKPFLVHWRHPYMRVEGVYR